LKTLPKLLLVTAVAAAAAFGTASAWAAAPAAAPAKVKNWTVPAQKIHAQKLSEQIMAKHPELISVTFHGVPPGLDKVYTMFAGSLIDRLGNPDDPDDIDVTTKGISIIDPRWHRTNDTIRKFVLLLPLRDKANESVGLLVLAYKNPTTSTKSELDYFKAASALRDSLRKDIPTYESLFEPAK
jgi:hypothetical protein